MEHFPNTPFTSDLSNDQLLNQILMLIDSPPLTNISGQTTSPAASDTLLQGQSLSALDQVQPPVAHHTAPSSGLYVDAYPSQIQPLELPISINDAQPSEQSSSTTRRSTRSTNRPKNFQCSQCPRLYDRHSRAQTCENNHLGIKRYRCGGRCGQPLCPKKYASPSGLDRHCLPHHERAISCLNCDRKITRHNMARHQKICGGPY